MPASKLDIVYRRILITHFFEKGWGKPENLLRLFQFRKIISQRNTCYPLVPEDYPVLINNKQKHSDCLILEGSFLTPLETHLPGIVPKVAQSAKFQVILPKNWRGSHKPMCIHLAGTGDHFFWRRRNLIAKPLLKEANIGAIILENPFYGYRKPGNQIRSSLHNVSDIFVMGGCLILECLVLLHWCERNGFGPLGITGLSMGGHMASLAATNWPKSIVLVPCLSWSTAATVFTTGVMSQSINWDMLETQYYSDGRYSERLSKMVTVIDDAFVAGQTFIRNFNQSLLELKKDIKNTTSYKSFETLTCTGKAEDYKISFIRLMNFILPSIKSVKNINVRKINWWEHQTLQFMRGMMDECTHLKNFSVPKETSLVIAVCAKDDAYVPREGCSGLEEIWPGVQVRYLDAGHVSGYLLHQKLFRSTIIEAFERAKKLNQMKTSDENMEYFSNKLTYCQILAKYVSTM